jgi:hypothetical protein
MKAERKIHFRSFFIISTLFVWGMLSAFSYANDPFVFDKNTNTLKHVNSGFVFPYTVGGFAGGDDIRQYDTSGNDVSVPYNLVRGDDFIAVTVYVYSAPAPGPDRNASDILNEHFEGLKMEILTTYKGSLSSEDKLNLKGMAGRKAAFKIELMGDTESELYLFIYKGWFIKYRISYPGKSAAFARPEISKFMNSLDFIPKN